MRFILFFSGILILLTGCSSAAKPAPDVESPPTPVPQEEVSVEPQEPTPEPTKEEPKAIETAYQKLLGPFFTVSAYVPYKVKVHFEDEINKVRNTISTDEGLLIKVVSYYPEGNDKEKVFAQARADNLVHYAEWKESMTKDHFAVQVASTTDEENYYQIEFAIKYISEGGKVRVATDDSMIDENSEDNDTDATMMNTADKKGIDDLSMGLDSNPAYKKDADNEKSEEPKDSQEDDMSKDQSMANSDDKKTVDASMGLSDNPEDIKKAKEAQAASKDSSEEEPAKEQPVVDPNDKAAVDSSMGLDK